MIIGLRGGHSANCVGAIGIVKEYEQMQEFYKAVSQVFTSYGHTVIDCNSNGANANAELSEGATKANNAKVDIFISLHMNAFDGSGNGVEALVSSVNSGAVSYATNLCNNFSLLNMKIINLILFLKIKILPYFYHHRNVEWLFLYLCKFLLFSFF